MIAYKAFNKDLQATMGNGIFQFEQGKTYEEKECKCTKNGFHCTENPLDTLSYYHGMDTRFFIVDAGGDINQDGCGTKISCTKLTLLKEISRFQLAALGCEYMRKYPERETENGHAVRDKGKCNKEGDFLIVRGKDPRVAGVKRSCLFLLKEKKDSKEIEGVWVLMIDGEEFKENTWYEIRGEEICERKN